MRKRVVIAHAGLRGDVLNSLYSLDREKLLPGQFLFKAPCGVTVWDTERGRGLITQEIELVRENADFVVMDIPAEALCRMPEVIYAAQALIVIATPDVESVVEAYAKIKRIVSVKDSSSVRLLVNMALNAEDAQAVKNRLVGVCKHFLKIELKCVNSLLFDPIVPKTVQEGGFLVRNHPYSKLSKSLTLLAQDLCRHTVMLTAPELLLQASVS